MSTNYSIKLVDHTSSPTSVTGHVQQFLQDIFNQVFKGTSDSATVGWGKGAQADSIVLHLVQDIAHSYLEQQWPGQVIDPAAGGHTHYRTALKLTGSEFYQFNGTQIRWHAMARLAFHECLHNQWPGWSAAKMHGPDGGGGLATKVVGQVLTQGNIDLMRKGLTMKNNQLF